MFLLVASLKNNFIKSILPIGLSEKEISLKGTHVRVFYSNDEYLVSSVEPSGRTKLGFQLTPDVPIYKVEIEISQMIKVSSNSTTQGPVYYLLDNKRNIFYCASHIHLFERINIVLEENVDILPEYLYFRCVATPNTLFKNVKLLTLGENICVQFKPNQVIVKNNFEVLNSTKNSTDNLIPSVDTLLKKELQKLVKSSNHVASLLSGGMDSSILFNIVNKSIHQTNSYSTDYPADMCELSSEKAYALSAADLLGANHNHYQGSAKEYFHALIDSIHAAEMPVHHQQSVLLYKLFQSGVDQKSTIFISGQGADTLCGADEIMKLQKILTGAGQLARNLPFKTFFSMVIQKIYKHLHVGYNLNKFLSTGWAFQNNSDHPLWSDASYGDLKIIQSKLKTSKKCLLAERMKLMRNFKNLEIRDFARQYSLITDTTVTSLIWERLANATGKHILFPFKSFEIIKTMNSIPWETHLKRQKHLVNELGKLNGVPELLLNRPKLSFGLDIHRWGGEQGVLWKLLKLFENGPLSEILPPQSLDITKYHGLMTSWALLNYYIWRHIFILRTPIETLHSKMDIFIKEKGY